MSLMRLIAAPLLLLLVSERCKLLAQVTQTTDNECITSCATAWKSLSTTIQDVQSFLKHYNNSLRDATDDYCKNVFSIMACYSKCKLQYTNVTYFESQVMNGAVSAAADWCATDESNCRAQDSWFWCSRTCLDGLPDYERCVRSVQLQRNCSLTNPVYRIQKVILVTILQWSIACLRTTNPFLWPNLTDVNELFIKVEVCQDYIPKVCLAPFTDPVTSLFTPYFNGFTSCRDVQSAKDCINTSIYGDVNLYGGRYSQPCKYLPYGSAILSNIVFAIEKLHPCGCFKRRVL